jgi:hypothetical protein
MSTNEQKPRDWLDDQVDELNEAFADIDISESLPENVDKDTADRLNNYAQSLDDPITHVVDYGNLEDGKKKK